MRLHLKTHAEVINTLALPSRAEPSHAEPNHYCNASRIQD